MAITRYSIPGPYAAHTIREFIEAGQSSTTKTAYPDFSYIETKDNKFEYVVKNVLEDYLVELKNMAIRVELNSKEVVKYKYNPKLLAFDLYHSTKVYYIILRLNDMCDVHQFDLSKRRLLLLPPSVLADSLAAIYKADYMNIKAYNTRHENDKTKIEIVPYR